MLLLFKNLFNYLQYYYSSGMCTFDFILRVALFSDSTGWLNGIYNGTMSPGQLARMSNHKQALSNYTVYLDITLFSYIFLFYFLINPNQNQG